MTFRLLLPLFMGASLILVGPPVFADDDDDESDRTAPAMQVMIDEKTGNLMEDEDDSGDSQGMTTTGMTDTGRNSNISAMIPGESQPPQYNADGSMSAQIGFEHFKYLVVTKDQSDELVMTHVPAGQFDAEALPKPADREEK